MSSSFHGSSTFQFGLDRTLGLPTLQKPQPMASLCQVALRRMQDGGGYSSLLLGKRTLESLNCHQPGESGRQLWFLGREGRDGLKSYRVKRK